jgi:hypothetical protein
MIVLHVKLARTIWLVDSRDLNPHGIDILPILDAIRTRYNFQVYPTKVEDANEYDPKGIVFMNGSFAATGSGRHTIVKATMYGDGLVVDSALSTDFCEAFLSDALTFLATQFGLTYRPEMIHTKIYTSELIVRTDKDLGKFFAPFASIRAKLNSFSGKTFDPFGFSFAVDKPGTGSPAPFKFEREVGKPQAQHRYYSSAPVRTSEHEELLRDLEELF